MSKTKHFLWILVTLCLSCSDGVFNGKTTRTLIPVKSNGKWGYITKDGKIKINPQFNNAFDFESGLALVQSPTGDYGYINEEGKYEIKAAYKNASSFSEGLAVVVKDESKPEFINDNGETVISVDADEVFNFTENRAVARKGDKWGMIDKTGELVIPFLYPYLAPARDGMLVYSENNLYGYIKVNGEIAIPAQFERCSLFDQGVAAVKLGDVWGLIDKQGNYLVNPQFSEIITEPYYEYPGFQDEEGLIRITQGGRYGCIDKNGEYILNPQFDFMGPFVDGYALILQEGKYGFIDEKGDIVVKPQFEFASNYDGGHAVVSLGNKFGLIDDKGKIVVNPQFESIRTKKSLSSVKSLYVDLNSVAEFLLNDVCFSLEDLDRQTYGTLLTFIENNPGDWKYDTNRIRFNGDLTKSNELLGTSRIRFDVQGYRSEKPVYYDVQKFDRRMGGYYVDKVFSHYDYQYNREALVTRVKIESYLKGMAQYKVSRVIEILAAVLSSKGFTELASSKDPWRIFDNGRILIAIAGEANAIEISSFAHNAREEALVNITP